VIERLLPAVIATADTRAELDVELFPEEARVVGRAVDKRRREFVTGRACARLALGHLGIAPTPIANGARGEPLWPSGVVGSITHCTGYRACAVARTTEVRSLGIDAEVDAPLPVGIFEQIASSRERALAGAAAGANLDRLIFSAKEAVYKAWYPITRQRLGFGEIELFVDVPDNAFRARLRAARPTISGHRIVELVGRWCVERDLIGTAVVLS
jgi:4'-phosphopantetheinyl transferase EntD